jgi:hypothetical protein
LPSVSGMAYSAACAEHGAPVGRSPPRGCTRKRKVPREGGRKRSRLGELFPAPAPAKPAPRSLEPPSSLWLVRPDLRVRPSLCLESAQSNQARPQYDRCEKKSPQIAESSISGLLTLPGRAPRLLLAPSTERPRLMVLRWVAASAEVNRKPDGGVTGSVHFFVRQDGDPPSGSPSRAEPLALRAAPLNAVGRSGSGFAPSPGRGGTRRRRGAQAPHTEAGSSSSCARAGRLRLWINRCPIGTPQCQTLGLRCGRNLRKVRVAVVLTGHVSAHRVAIAPSTERPRLMALREAPGVSRWSVGKPDEGVTGSVHFRFRVDR